MIASGSLEDDLRAIAVVEVALERDLSAVRRDRGVDVLSVAARKGSAFADHVRSAARKRVGPYSRCRARTASRRFSILALRSPELPQPPARRASQRSRQARGQPVVWSVRSPSCGRNGNESSDACGASLSVDWAEARRVGESVRACRQWAIRRCGPTLSSEGPGVKGMRSLLPQTIMVAASAFA